MISFYKFSKKSRIQLSITTYLILPSKLGIQKIFFSGDIIIHKNLFQFINFLTTF